MADGGWEDATEQLGWWDTAKSALQTADDFGRAGVNTLTFGMADRVAGYLGGEGTDAEVAKSAAARERSPYASIAGDVTSSLAIPGFGAEMAALRVGKALAPTLGRAAPAVGRAVGYGATGAATGAAQGAGNTYTGNLPDYAQNAVIGGALGGVFGGAGGAAFGRAPAVSRAEVPKTAELWAEKNANYGALAKSKAAYEPQYLKQAADDVEAKLFAERFHPRDSPRTWQALDEMRGAPTPGQLGVGTNAIIDPANIDFIRKGINKIPAGEAAATDRASGRIVKEALDDFITKPPQGAVLPGTERAAAEAAALADRARGNYAGFKRGQRMDNLITAAQDTTGATHSGLNLQNELRKGVRTFIKPNATAPTRLGGYTKDEIAALRDFTRGNIATNLLRGASAATGGGGGIGSGIAAAAGGTAGGIAGKYFSDDPETAGAIGLLTPVVGMGLRRWGNKRADREIAQIGDMLRQRTPLYRERVARAGTMPGPGQPKLAKGMRDAVALELLRQQQVGMPSDTDWK